MTTLLTKPLKENLISELKANPNLTKLSFYLYSDKDNLACFYYLKGIKKLLEFLSIPYFEGFLDRKLTKEENLSTFKEESHEKFVILARPLSISYEEDFISSINPDYDPDMMSLLNKGKLYSGDLGYLPATAQSVKHIIDSYSLSLKGKKCLVVGRSLTVGLPVMELINRYDGLVTLAHSKVDSQIFSLEAIESDFIFLCSGKSGLIPREFFSPEQTIIDCGFSANGGDLGFVPSDNELSAYTPVPGGVGVLTSCFLIKNALLLLESKISKN